MSGRLDRRAVLKGFAGMAVAAGGREALAANAPQPVAFVREGNLWVAAPDGSNLNQLTRTGRDSYPAWSRDGEMLAFLRRADADHDDDFGQLHVIRRDRSGLSRMTPYLCTAPRWSPLADEIAAVGSPKAEQLRLLFLSPAGRPTREAIPLEMSVQPPPWGWMALSDWHPAGKLMSFRVMGHLTREGLIAEPGNGILKRHYDLSHLPQLDEEEVSAFSWRPGHDEAAAISAPGLSGLRRFGRENYTRTVWLCKPDGTRLRALYHSKVLGFSTLAWEPDGRSVVFESGGMLMRAGIEHGAVSKLWTGGQPAWASHRAVEAGDRVGGENEPL